MKDTWLPLAITMAIQAMVSMAVLFVPVMAPVIAPALGVSAAFTGLYVALVYAGAVIGSLAGPGAVARFGAIRVSQIGLLTSAVGLLMCTIAWLPALALGAFLVGIGNGPITPASSHLLAKSTPAHRMSMVFSVKQTGVPIGGMLAGALVPVLLLLLGWQGALLVAAAANCAAALAALPLRKEMDADRQPGRPLAFAHLGHPIKIVLQNRALLLISVCAFFFTMTQQILSSYLVTYLHDVLAYGLVAAGLALSLAQIAGICGRIFWGWVADRWFQASTMLAMLAALMVVGALGTALISTAMPTPLVYLILFVFGSSAIGWNGIMLADVARRAQPGTASVATGGALAFTFFGGALGPPVFGLLADGLHSLRPGFALLSLPLVGCVIALARTRRAKPV